MLFIEIGMHESVTTFTPRLNRVRNNNRFATRFSLFLRQKGTPVEKKIINFNVYAFLYILNVLGDTRRIKEFIS